MDIYIRNKFRIYFLSAIKNTIIAIVLTRGCRNKSLTSRFERLSNNLIVFNAGF